MQSIQVMNVVLFPDNRMPWRKSGMCGVMKDLSDGSPAECDPDGERPCCSKVGRCGATEKHCSCVGCIDYRKLRDWRDAGNSSKGVETCTW